ncbi:anthranilate synthase component II [Varunaivibrio sulfuroxidans]|uniref:Anthranilate synthase component II n=2 Tax=Varunaivibrio sulfuroxidans TaxID=1773489 RepID=A0A4R3JEG2_9PROT|nr:anthranilate synthase component II [Varunaivibrio sulfuroxidans]
MYLIDMFLLIDNYDSFTYNLLHYLGELGANVVVKRNDALSAEEALALRPQGVVISPGPCDPDRAGICLDLIAKAPADLAILGVCLGHQCIGQHSGAIVVRAPQPMHGKISAITHTGQGIFAGIESPFNATRYHSLTLARENFPDTLSITAQSDDGVIQGIQHKTRPLFGVQFHPESIRSQHGHTLLKNFMDLTRHTKAAA